jgi:hypothetical protein
MFIKFTKIFYLNFEIFSMIEEYINQNPKCSLKFDRNIHLVKLRKRYVFIMIRILMCLQCAYDTANK